MSHEFSTPDAVTYLEAKQHVDGGALNPAVREAVLAHAVGHAAPKPVDEPVWVLDAGAGLGAGGMALFEALRVRVERPVHMVVVDSNRHLLSAHRDRILAGGGWKRTATDTVTRIMTTRAPGVEDQIIYRHGDLLASDLLADMPPLDLLHAQSFVDMFDLRVVIRRAEELISTGGVLYAPITVDGGTAFGPDDMDPDLEAQLIEAYERSIDERAGADREPAAGGRYAGRALVDEVERRQGWALLAEGPSAWDVNGTHSAEVAFMTHILRFFEESLTGRPGVDQNSLIRWLVRRRSDVAAGVLRLRVNNRDVAAVYAP